VLTSATEPRLLRPLQIGESVLQVEQTARQLRLEALGGDVKALRVQLYDLSGRVLIDQASRASELVIPLVHKSGRPLAQGVYLYVLTLEGSFGARTTLQKLIVSAQLP
jgi:hypothetical protein